MVEITCEDFKKFMMNDWKYSSGQYIDSRSSPDLYKLLVVGHVITRFDNTISSFPITSCDDYTDNDQGGYDLRDNEEFITVIPATTRMFKVCAFLPDGTPEEIMFESFSDYEFKILGWEYEGLPVPDWDKIYREECFRFIWNNYAKSISA